MAVIFMTIGLSSGGQQVLGQAISFQDYYDDLESTGDEYLSQVEEWHDMITHRLAYPVSVNSAEMEQLQDIGIISALQWHRLREYRLMYGDLLSVYELPVIEGWDQATFRRVMPLVAISPGPDIPFIPLARKRRVRQQLILKTAFSPETREGYREEALATGEKLNAAYQGNRMKFTMRYDLEVGRNLMAGIRLEKDPGEPLLVRSPVIGSKDLAMPDHLSGFIQLKKPGLVDNFILGDFQVRFGFGLNLGAGNYGSSAGQPIGSMAGMIRPHTSMNESIYFRGAGLTSSFGKFQFSAYASKRKLDGSSIVRDEATGTVESFSSINESGLHRTHNEIARKNTISEGFFGGHLNYGNRWMKAGLIAFYHRFNSRLERGKAAYHQFHFNGKSGLVTGFSIASWLKKIQLFAEGSRSGNGGLAVYGGLLYEPVPGSVISISYRSFGKNYQNRQGAGVWSPGRNSDEKGVAVVWKTDLPGRNRLFLSAGCSRSRWVSYNLDFPSRQYRVTASWEKSWKMNRDLIFSLQYNKSTVTETTSFSYFSKPINQSKFRIRAEGRYEAIPGTSMKTRIETGAIKTGNENVTLSWLLFHDVGYSPPGGLIRFWLRICLFQAMDYENRMYAYENDVLYDFSSFMYYGKGIRTILMVTCKPARWLEMWLRLSSVNYSGKKAGSGTEAVAGSRASEVEFQVRLRNPN